MANTKHTPGPWGINKYGGIGAGEFFINPIINSDGFAHEWDAPSRERYDADVRLIAAAPDMLAALETIADKPIGPSDATYREVYESIVEIARTAIAKAKGE